MMKSPVKLLTALIFMLSVFDHACAGLSVKQAVKIALKENPAVRTYSWEILSQEQDLKSAKGHLFPKIMIKERISRTNSPTYGFMSKLNQERFTQKDFLLENLNSPGNTTDFQTSISFKQPVFVPEVYHHIDISRTELEAKRADYSRIKAEVAFSVIKRFLYINTAEEYLKLARTALKESKEHRKIASLRYGSGTGLYSDVLRTEVSVKNAEARIIKSEGDLEIAKQELGLVLGRTVPVEILEEKIILPVNELDVYLDASKQRDDLKAFRLRQQNSRKAVGLKRSSFIPEIGIGGSYNLHDNSSPFSPGGGNYYVMGFLEWNIFDISSYHSIRRAEARAGWTGERLSGLEKEITFRVREAYTRVREKEKHLALARAGLEEAEEAMRLVKVRYENSLAPMVDLLDTQVVLDSARAGLVKAGNDYVIAVAHLYFESGILLDAVKNMK